MWPWMNQGFSPMYGMGGGFGGYPQMQGGFQSYQPQAPSGAQQGDARIDKLRGRVSNLQEQMKGAGTEQMAGMQARMDQMQGRIKGLRQDRRQGEGLYAQPAAGAQGQGDQNYWTADRMRNAKPMPMPTMPGGGNLSYGGGMGMGGGMPQFGGMNYGGGMQSWMQQPMMYGGYNSGANQTGLAEQGQMPTGAQRPGMQYRQDRRQALQGGNEMAQAGQQQGGAPSWYEAGSFDTPFGNLVQSSVGNGNIYKQNGSDGQSLYHYDPTQGWKHMTQQEYMGYNNPADFYQDPNQYAAAAGGNKSQMQMRNGMYQNMLGTGTYR